MKVFEFHFNPKNKEDIVFDSFCFEPSSIDERRLGNLYTVGELKNPLPQNYKLIDLLSNQIKKEFYLSSLRSPERALTDGLKRGNDFLESLIKKGDVSWLGNLNFAVLSVKDSVFHFTKAEKMFAFLLRGGKIVNIAQKLAHEEINPYPLKFFGNIISGKLANEDIVLLLTKEIANFFISENILNEISSLSVFTDKKLKEILYLREKQLKDISGVAVLVVINEEKEKLSKTGIPQILKFDSKKESFSLKEALSPLIKILELILKGIVKILRKIPLPNFRFNIPLLKISHTKVNRSRSIKKSKKNILIFGAFAIILIAGFYLFQLQGQKDLAKANQMLATIQEKNINAKNLFDAGNKKESNFLFLQALADLDNLRKTLPVSEKNPESKIKVNELQREIESYLLQLNNLKIIENPEIIFDFSKIKNDNGAVFIPQKMSRLENKIYFFGSAIKNILEVDITTKTSNLIKNDKKFALGFPFDPQSIMLYAEPDAIDRLDIFNSFQENKIKLPSGKFNFVDLKTNFSNLYFLDDEQNTVLKCPYVQGTDSICQYWFSKENTKNPGKPVSFAIDGSIWILNQDGNIDRYWAGTYQGTLKLNVFPNLEKASRIYTVPGIPYLYVFEQLKNRILVFTKSGEIVKQFQSEKFDNIKDIAISTDGKTIYLLNSVSLYKIDF